MIDNSADNVSTSTAENGAVEQQVPDERNVDSSDGSRANPAVLTMDNELEEEGVQVDGGDVKMVLSETTSEKLKSDNEKFATAEVLKSNDGEDRPTSNVFGTLDFTPDFGELSKNRSGVSLEWEKVYFKVKDREILKHVSGKVDSRELCALLGPSGAGKSSLTNILAGRLSSDKKKKIVSGDIKVNGELVNPISFRKNIAYVLQQDSLFATSTAREALEFSAKLRLPRNTTKEEREKIVNSLINALGLSDVQDTFCGSELLRGLSGGERKRVSIGVELVTNPKLLFLDEPTSGLDSYSAWKVVSILKALSRSGCACLCTIHQPSSEIFSLFDRVMMLAHGNVMYNGSVEEMPIIFKRLGFEVPALTNPADYIMVLAQTRQADQLPSYNELTDKEDGPSAEDDIKREGSSIEVPKKLHNVRASSPITQMKLLTIRELKNVIRNKPQLIARFGIMIFLNVLFGCIFYMAGKLTGDDYEINSHYGALVNMLISALFGAAQAPLLTFTTERVVFLREYSTGTYSSAPYFISKLLVELPNYFIDAAVILAISYPMMHFNGNFIVLLLEVFVIQIVSASYAYLIGALATDAKQAQEFVPILFVPQLLFAGFFIRVSQIPEWLRWVQYLCSLKYGINLAMLTEFGGNTCAVEGNATLSAERIAGCHYIIERNDVDEDLAWLYVVLLLAIFFCFRLGSLIGLIYRARNFSS